MAWVRAVWQERKRQEEGTVPDSWVDTENMLLFWPNIANATRHLKECRKPSEGWRKFPLLKEKMRSGGYTYMSHLLCAFCHMEVTFCFACVNCYL